MWLKACTEQGHAMLCHTCSDEGDSPVVIRFCSIHRFCSHTISVYNLPHER